MTFSLGALVPLCLLAAGTLPAQTFNLKWSSIINGGRADAGRATAVDKDGGIWVAGSSSSSFVSPDVPFPIEPYQKEPKGKNDIFVAKFQARADGGTTVLFWTWIGGTGDEELRAMSLDSRGRVVLTGATDSTDFPMAGNAFQTANGGGTDAFIAVLDPTVAGEFSLVFSSYYGGTNTEQPNAIAIAPDNSIVVAGITRSDNLPNVSGSVQGNNRGGWDSFLFKVNPAADSPLQYATYFGGGSTDGATGVTIAGNGVIWLAGYTASTDFPVTGDAFQSAISISHDAFLVALDVTKPGIDAFLYGTYYGGSGSDVPVALSFDSQGSLWLAQHTSSGDLRVTPDAMQPLWGGATDAYVVKLDITKPAGEWVQYATYFGGEGHEVLYGFVLMPAGRFALAGYTMFGGLPTAGTPYQPIPASEAADSFVTVINPAASNPTTNAIEYSTYYGGNQTDVGTGIAADPAGGVVVTGYTDSYDLTGTDGTIRRNLGGSPSGFVYRFSRSDS